MPDIFARLSVANHRSIQVNTYEKIKQIKYQLLCVFCKRIIKKLCAYKMGGNAMLFKYTARCAELKTREILDSAALPCFQKFLSFHRLYVLAPTIVLIAI